MWITLGIALAGGVGAGLRFVVDTLISRRLQGTFPWGTALINLTGSFLLGIVLVLWTSTSLGWVTLTCAILTGALGGFTTFSSASFEAARLIQQGEVKKGLGYALGWLAICVVGMLLGMSALRLVMS